MQFVFNDRKTVQAASHLLQLHGGSMPYIKLIKLMYLADRRSLIETGYPITGDKLVSMDHGPVLSRVLNLITWGRRGGFPGAESEWPRYISAPDGYDVHLTTLPEFDELSEYELATLDAVFEQFGDWDRWKLVEYTHSLPEWEDPSGTSIAIDVRTILREAGHSDEEIREVASQAEAIRSFRAAFS